MASIQIQPQQRRRNAANTDRNSFVSSSVVPSRPTDDDDKQQKRVWWLPPCSLCRRLSSLHQLSSRRRNIVVITRLPPIVLVSCLIYFVILVGSTTTIERHRLYGSSGSKTGGKFWATLIQSLLFLHREHHHDEQPILSSSSSLASTELSVTATSHHMAMSSSTSTTSLQNASFRILCTSTNKKIEWGSYQIRCRDFKSWAERCCHRKDGGVHIVTDLSFSDMYRRRWIRWWLGKLRPEEQYTYNATIFVKSFPSLNRLLPQVFGKNLFVDLVDEYGYAGDDIPRQYHLIAQTPWQGPEVFPGHKSSAVEHWYNSYPADMMISSSAISSTGGAHGGDEDDPKDIPVVVDDNQPLDFATIWNTKRDKEPSEGGCPALSMRHQAVNITYSCLDLEFDISKWYLQYILPTHGQRGSQQQQHRHRFQSIEEARADMEATLRDPFLGPGKLYYNIFQNFDVLVVLTKNDIQKIRYGNIQRTISQMRSGVPVLVEIRGRVLHDFMDKYNYTCAFQRYPDDFDDGNTKENTIDLTSTRKYWTFDEAIEGMRKADVRRKCQRQGLDIVKDYSPSKIGQKFLRTVGYKGDFVC